MPKRRPRGDEPLTIRKTVWFPRALYAAIEADAARRDVAVGVALREALAAHYRLAPHTCSKQKIHAWGEWMDALPRAAREAVVALGDHLAAAGKARHTTRRASTKGNRRQKAAED